MGFPLDGSFLLCISGGRGSPLLVLTNRYRNEACKYRSAGPQWHTYKRIHTTVHTLVVLMGDIAQGDEGEDENGGSAHHHRGSYRVHPDVAFRPHDRTAHFKNVYLARARR